MKSIKLSAAAVLVMATAMVGAANAQDQSQQQDPWSGWMMGPRAMMGYGGPGSWMMGSGGSSQAMCNVMANHIEPSRLYQSGVKNNGGPRVPVECLRCGGA